MFDFPRLPVTQTTRSAVYQFTGLDRRERIADGACREMVNLSSDAYPCLTVRKPREQVECYTAPTAVIWAGGKPAVVDGTSFLYGGERIGTVTAGKKQMAKLGHRLAIWPDKMLFDTKTKEFVSLEASIPAGAAVFTHNTVTLSSGTFPFKVGDGVTISGCAQEYNNRTVVVQEVDGDTLTVYDNVFQYGELDSGQPEHWEERAVSFARTVPDLDFVCEKDNRLWGTHDNAICSCKLGDPYNWNVFNGLSTDAYEVEVGTDGAFTGCAPYGQHILFFKEHCVHKLYGGGKPSSYQVLVSHIEGVKTGCEKTIVNLNETLFYLSNMGVMAYSGAVPDCISEPLRADYTEAAAGAAGGKLYLCGKTGDEWEIVNYDTASGIWMREDNLHVRQFASDAGVLYMLTESGLTAAGQGGEAVSWEAVFGYFEEVYAEKKQVSRLHIIAELDGNAALQVEIECDGRGWHFLHWVTGGGVRQIPIIPERCHRWRVRVSGEGRVVLRSLVRKYDGGSDL